MKKTFFLLMLAAVAVAAPLVARADDIEDYSLEMHKRLTPTEQQLVPAWFRVLGHINETLQPPVLSEEERLKYRGYVNGFYRAMERDVKAFWEKHQKEIAAIYAKTLSRKELKVYLEFLRQPEAAAIAQKMGMAQEEIDQLMQKYIEAAMEKRTRQLQDAIIKAETEGEKK